MCLTRSRFNEFLQAWQESVSATISKAWLEYCGDTGWTMTRCATMSQVQTIVSSRQKHCIELGVFHTDCVLLSIVSLLMFLLHMLAKAWGKEAVSGLWLHVEVWNWLQSVTPPSSLGPRKWGLQLIGDAQRKLRTEISGANAVWPVRRSCTSQKKEHREQNNKSQKMLV